MNLLIDYDDVFVIFSAEWQYLQLKHLFVSKYHPAALSVSESPLLPETLIESLHKMELHYLFINILCPLVNTISKDSGMNRRRS